MANFTAADVKKLRDLTGAGMMDCKKALEEADGDFDKAVEILRVKGAKDVNKRAGRTAANGLVAHSGNALLELNCETDFVAKNADFVALAQQIWSSRSPRPSRPTSTRCSPRRWPTAVRSPPRSRSSRPRSARSWSSTGSPCWTARSRSTCTARAADLPPQVGVMVAYTGKESDEASLDDARGIAMQIAAMRPKYLTRDEVPADVIETERRVAEQTAKEEGKPEAALSRRSSRVGSTPTSRTSSWSSRRRCRTRRSRSSRCSTETGLTVTKFARFEVGQA